jgi:toxin ParE1/3/4
MIFEEINFICRKPYFGNKMDHIRDGYLASKVKSHLIFYKIENETIKIIRILHERMDIENRLNG